MATLITSLRIRMRLLAEALRSDTRGNVSIEAIILVPMLFWAYMMIYGVFDAYRKQTDGLRVSYAVADAISREENAIDQQYLDSMITLADYMTNSPSPVTQRVTIVCYSAENTEYHVAWSKTSGGYVEELPPHTNATLNQSDHRLPEIVVGDQVILVETFVHYAPLLNLSITQKMFDYWTFTRPRFTNQVKYENEDEWVCPAA
ncbi:MAG: hypothetical protein AAFQ54_05925 [Pseudomonadota bacterium]